MTNILVPYSPKAVTQFSAPLRGEKNKKTGSTFETANLETSPRHFHPSRGYKTESRLSFPFTGVSFNYYLCPPYPNQSTSRSCDLLC